MSNYTITTDFGAKDDLPSGNAAKVIKGSEFTTEFTNIKTAVNSKADSVSPTFTGNTALNGTTTFGPDGTSTFNGTVNFTKDVTFDTNTMFVDVSENRVGIGTTNPAESLHTSGNIRFGDTAPAEFYTNSSELRLGVDKNNDNDTSNITFYTNNEEKVRINKDGRLGIGTTNPLTTLHVSAATNIPVYIETTHAGGNTRLEFRNPDYRKNIGVNSDGAFTVYDITNSKTPFQILNNVENNTLVLNGSAVGIGNTTTPQRLTVGEGVATIGLQPDDTNGSYIRVGGTGASTNILRILGHSDVEKARFTASGKLLIGKTDESVINTVGIEAHPAGLLVATRDDNIPLIANRKTTQGDIVQFRNNNTVVGSIGNTGTRLFIGSGATALMYDGSNNYIVPWNTNSNTGRDGAVDLGVSPFRFKDLYLSGGVHLGGTGSANKLDDYEEGDWTMRIQESGTGNQSSSTNANCKYTKIGRVVHVQGHIVDINNDAFAGTGTLQIAGLPFTQLSSHSTRGHGSIQVNGLSGDSVEKGLFVQGQSGTNYALVKFQQTNSGAGTIQVSQLNDNDGSDIFFALTYTTT